jgi:hypothetical protein
MEHFMRNFSILSLAAVSLQAAIPAASARETQTQVANIEADLPVTEWVGIAASPNRRVFEVTSQRNEAAARSAAKFECEQASGRTCTAIAVPMSWDVVVMSCTRPGQSPVSFVGGSGESAAAEVVLAKAHAAGFYPATVYGSTRTDQVRKARPRNQAGQDRSHNPDYVNFFKVSANKKRAFRASASPRSANTGFVTLTWRR